MTDDLRERIAVLLAQGDLGHRDVSLVDRVVALIRAERAAALELAAGISDTEEELDGDMPLDVREALFGNPTEVMRAAVRATKKSISKRIRSRAEEERHG